MPFINRCGGGGSAKLQSKTVKSTTSQQTVSPDSGYDGFSSVTVSPMKLQAKSVSPSTTSVKALPDSGYDGLSQVTVAKMNLVSKTVTPSSEQQTVYPGAGYNGLSSVTVEAVNVPNNPIGILGTATNNTSGGKSLSFNLGDGMSSSDLSTLDMPSDYPIQFIIELAPTDSAGSITKDYGLIHGTFSMVSNGLYSCACYTDLGYAITINKVGVVYNAASKLLAVVLPESADWTISATANESSSSGSMSGSEEKPNATTFDDVVFNGTTNYPATYYVVALWQ